jgi:hypothetical protein
MRIRTLAIGLACMCVQSVGVHAAGPLVGTSLNGTPLADQFAGGDMCAKISAAIASLGSTGGIVDATHFTGTQACASDPSVGVSAAVVVEIGNVTMQLTVPWKIQSNLFKLRGAGPGHSGIQYVGTMPIAAVITLAPPDPTSQGANFVDAQLQGFHIWGNSHVTDGILLQAVHRSQLRDLSIWSVANCGLHVQWGVSNTYDNIHVAVFEAESFGMLTAPAATPAHGVCLDQYTTGPTDTGGRFSTASTVIGSVVEGVSGSGWYLPFAAGMHFSAGTSESNGKGIEIAEGSFSNTFTNSDLESNTQDVLDNGYNNVYTNLVSTSIVEFTATARHNTLIAGSVNSLKIDSGAAGISFEKTSIGNSSGTLTNNGTGTNNAASTGFAMMSLPGTNNAAILVDPVSDAFSTYYFAAASTTPFNQLFAVSSGQPWRALLVGYWANNYEGGLLNPPGEITEVTSASPVLNIGSVQLAFSVNSSGHLQATNGNGTYAAVFSGHVIFLPEINLVSAGTHSISVRGTVSAAALQTTSGTPSSSGASCEPNGMWADANYIYVCVAPNTIKRVLLSSF